jgi:hypothetical protein
LDWGLPQHAGSSGDAYRFTGHERGLRNSKTVANDKESSPLSIAILCFTVVIPLLGRDQPVLLGSRTGDLHDMQEAAGMPTGLLGPVNVRRIFTNCLQKLLKMLSVSLNA